MTGMPVERTDLPEDPYRPFPTFEHFSAAPVDLSTIEAFVALLEFAKASAGPEQLSAAVDRATRWAAVDTGALENLYDVDRGFTMTVAAEAAAWEAMQNVVGDDAARSINDAFAAYEFVLDIVTNFRPITESWIRELHAVICASQDTYTVLTSVGKQEHALPKGEYKHHPNNPYNLRVQKLHGYAPVLDTPAEMARLVTELASADFDAAAPALQAAYAHYAFVCVHPFADGNGRVARALASVFLYRSPGVPLVIFADQKAEYLSGLESADAGDYRPFSSFIRDCSIDVVRMVCDSIQQGARPPAHDVVEDLRSNLLGRGGMPHEQVDALAELLLDEWYSAVSSAAAASGVEYPMSLGSGLMGGSVITPPDGYRTAPGLRGALLSGSVAGPGQASVQKLYSISIARGRAQLSDFLVLGQHGTVIDAIIRDLSPGPSPSLKYRLGIAAEGEVSQLVQELVSAAQERLRAAGYTD